MDKRRMPRAVSAAAALTVAIAGLAGCSSSSSSGGDSSKAVTLKLVAADYGTGAANTSQTYWQGIATAFHQANPTISVNVKTIDWNDFDNQVQTMIQNKQYPDVTEGDYFSTYAQEGLLYSAGQVLTNPGDLLSAFQQQGSYQGTQYGLPFTTSSRTLFYNKKVFTQAGITAAPQSWNDIQTDAAKIKGVGKIGFGLPLGSEEAQAESLLWMLGNGGGYQTDGKYTINSQQNIGAFQFLNTLVAAGDTEPNPASVNRTDLWQKFAQGDVGMINGSPALIPIIQSGKVLQDSDWASVPIAGKAGPLTQTLGVCDNVAAFKSNGHQAQIKKFLDFVYQTQYQTQFDKEYDLLPATQSALTSMQSDATFGPFLKALPQSVQYPSDTVWPQLKTKIQQTIGTAVTADPGKTLGQLQQVAAKG